ncbi:hypothetical protein DFH09DRAFT_1193690 [Mycena vulgaris]|nr:hypothetical protein DFH09DRAFT_1193690 [Mycena vulgaris]
MANAVNPLLIQELADQCIGYLPTDPASDLKACALVCKSWTRAAQRRLFRVVFIPTAPQEKRCFELQTTLRDSPHLVRHVRRLVLHRDAQRSMRGFSMICVFPFTHLEHVSIHYFCEMSRLSATPLKCLLSLPTLRRVEMDCQLVESVTFLQIWDDCSPNIKHLLLKCFNPSRDPLHPSPRSSGPIMLESLRLDRINRWLMHDFCPFDFSRLTVLSIHDTSVIGWKRMAPALRTIEALNVEYAEEALDLSLFPRLSFLRISNPRKDEILATLSTITSSSRVRQIVLSFGFINPDVCDQFDVKHIPTVGFLMDTEAYSHSTPFFPRLTSQNRLRRTDPDTDWFERYIGHEDIFEEPGQ